MLMKVNTQFTNMRYSYLFATGFSWDWRAIFSTITSFELLLALIIGGAMAYAGIYFWLLLDLHVFKGRLFKNARKRLPSGFQSDSTRSPSALGSSNPSSLVAPGAASLSPSRVERLGKATSEEAAAATKLSLGPGSFISQLLAMVWENIKFAVRRIALILGFHNESAELTRDYDERILGVPPAPVPQTAGGTESEPSSGESLHSENSPKKPD